jgi:hypothetical protein
MRERGAAEERVGERLRERGTAKKLGIGEEGGIKRAKNRETSSLQRDPNQTYIRKCQCHHQTRIPTDRMMYDGSFAREVSRP